MTCPLHNISLWQGGPGGKRTISMKTSQENVSPARMPDMSGWAAVTSRLADTGNAPVDQAHAAFKA